MAAAHAVMVVLNGLVLCSTILLNRRDYRARRTLMIVVFNLVGW